VRIFEGFWVLARAALWAPLTVIKVVCVMFGLSCLLSAIFPIVPGYVLECSLCTVGFALILGVTIRFHDWLRR